MPTPTAPQPAGALARLSQRIAGLWPRRTEAKASHAGHLIALETGRGEPVWTPRDYQAFAREGMMQNAIVYRSVRMIAENAASVPLLVYEGDNEISEHPLIDLLRRPSPGLTGTDLLESFFGFLLVSGNAYIEAAAIGGHLRELHVLRPDRMKVIPGADGWPEAFEYTAGGASVRIGGEPVPGVSAILHMKLFHPANDHYGLSPIEAAAAAIDLHNASARWNKALLDNSARPSGALVYASGQHMTGEQFERLKSELEASFQGARNAGRPLLLEGGLDWRAMSLSPRDMDFLEARHAAAREIALAIGVPPMLLGIPGDNTYANYAEANRAFWRQTVLPLVNRLARALSGWIAPAYGGELRVVPDLDQVDALAPERDALWARMERTSFLTDDEKRAAVGYGDNTEGGDSAARPFARKYREDQARDDQGRWVDEGGSEGTEAEFVPTQGRGPRRPPTAPPTNPPAPSNQMPPAKVPVPPGTTIRNKDLAGKRHPDTGMPFDSQGFADFSSVAKATVSVPHTGVRNTDFAAANRAAGIPEVPDGWTWHHHQNGRTMQLVPREIHRRTGHTGSIGIDNLPGRKMEWKSMAPAMHSSNKPISQDDLRSFEGELGYSLPSAHSTFLLATNGGRPVRGTFAIQGFPMNPVGSIHHFFGLGTEIPSYDMREIFRWFSRSIPGGILPIACTEGIDYICLDLRGGTDRVAYWDQHHHWGTGEWREHDLYHIADSFATFLLSLQPNPDS